MPAEGVELTRKNEILTFAEISRLTHLFAELGIRKVRLTGGEPLVRKGIESLCEDLSSIPGIQTLGITTNGVFLGDKASALKLAGVQEVNISLDTLRPERFHRITLREEYEAVRNGILSALAVGFRSIKINTVVMKGFNDDELLDFAEFAISHALNLRFIEYMPFLGNRWSEAQCWPYREMKDILETKYRLMPVESSEPLRGPARDFQIDGTEAVIGFISTMSEGACAFCNRLRLTSDGKLRNCLFSPSECDLKRLLRSGAGEHHLRQAIMATTALKWRSRPQVNELLQIQNRTMSAIGG
jgi:cyclic pyranopterin phosphate synthase